MFGSGAVERAYSVLAAENRDLRDAIRRERDSWATERKELIDRIIALTNPHAVAVLNPQPVNRVVMAENTKQRRINHPGYSTRPPLPPYPQRAGEGAPPPEPEAS